MVEIHAAYSQDSPEGGSLEFIEAVEEVLPGKSFNDWFCH